MSTYRIKCRIKSWIKSQLESRFKSRVASRISQLLLSVFFLLGLSQAVLAQTPKTVFLEELSWTELQEQIRNGKSTIIVPIGGTEQSGPDIALGKHNVRARLLAEKIAQRLGDALVAPVVAYVPEGGIEPPTAHMRFPGTITIPDEAFDKLLESAARSFKHHGFKDVVFLGDHGGYYTNLNRVAERLNRNWRSTQTRAHVPKEYYRAADTEFAATLKKRGYSDEEIGTHAGLADTSLTLALDPRLVRLEHLRSGVKFERNQGVYGAPQRASAELGQLAVNEIVANTSEAIKKSVLQR
ncbi:hypothetical protein BH11PSE11_BH11PSE11_03610 [soil metagenome]